MINLREIYYEQEAIYIGTDHSSFTDDRGVDGTREDNPGGCRRSVGISEQTYYKWRKDYGGLQISQSKKLKELEKENARLKKAFANLTLDNLILKEATEGNG